MALYDGSRPLLKNMHERYARLRAAALPRGVAYRKAGNTAKNSNVVDAGSCRLEKKPGVRERIDYLVRQAQDRIIEKRAALEEQLWGVLEADIGDCFETYEAAKVDKGGSLETDAAGKMKTVRKQRPRLLSDLPRDVRKVIEDVIIDKHGNIVPRLYSKAAANKGLRELLDIGRREPEANDASRLSDAELVAQLAEQANQLGVKIDLSYSFDQQQKPDDEPTEANGEVTVAQPVAAGGSGADAQHGEEDRRAAEAAREMKISAQPSPQRRQDAPFAGAQKKTR